jgi:hypothetical protein
MSMGPLSPGESWLRWCVALVRRPDSAGLPPASEALACVSGTGQKFRIELSSSKRVCLDGSQDWKTDFHTSRLPLRVTSTHHCVMGPVRERRDL